MNNKENSVKNAFPFRLGTTSFIVPADLSTNVAALCDKVDDIEVVLFESEIISNLPDEVTIALMKEKQKQSGVSYTIHFPLDVNPGSDDPMERKRSVQQCVRIIELMTPLSPFGYVLHLPIGARGIQAPKRPDAWLDNVHDGIRNILKTGVAPSRICVETLSYPFDIAWQVVESLHLSVCLDVGHVLLNGYSYKDYMDRYFERARIIHLHGIVAGTDHQSVAYFPEAELDFLMARLMQGKPDKRVLTMEVFNESDFASSMARLKEYAR